MHDMGEEIGGRPGMLNANLWPYGKMQTRLEDKAQILQSWFLFEGLPTNRNHTDHHNTNARSGPH